MTFSEDSIQVYGIISNKFRLKNLSTGHSESFKTIAHYHYNENSFTKYKCETIELYQSFLTISFLYAVTHVLYWEYFSNITSFSWFLAASAKFVTKFFDTRMYAGVF